MPGASVTIFWIEVTDDEAFALERVARAKRARVVQVRMYSLASMAFPALAQGAVLFVARTEQEATRALGLGVDEVIRTGDITEQALDEKLSRAATRAEARASFELRRGLFQDDDDLALAALVSAFGRRLAVPITSAALACELLESALAVILDLDDAFVECAVRGSPADQARDLAVRRLANPPSRELLRALGQAREELDRASSLVATLAGLASRAEASAGGSIAQLVQDIVAVMSADYATWATFVVDARGPCRVAVPPVTVSFILSSLIVNAVDAVRAGREDGGRVEVRLSEHEDTVLLEVQDNGRPVRTDVLPGALDPYFDPTRSNRTGLARARDRMRRCGGDLQIDSGERGTTVRVLLPTTTDEAAFDSAAAETGAQAASKDRRN